MFYCKKMADILYRITAIFLHEVFRTKLNNSKENPLSQIPEFFTKTFVVIGRFLLKPINPYDMII